MFSIILVFETKMRVLSVCFLLLAFICLHVSEAKNKRAKDVANNGNFPMEMPKEERKEMRENERKLRKEAKEHEITEGKATKEQEKKEKKGKKDKRKGKKDDEETPAPVPAPVPTPVPAPGPTPAPVVMPVLVPIKKPETKSITAQPAQPKPEVVKPKSKVVKPKPEVVEAKPAKVKPQSTLRTNAVEETTVVATPETPIPSVPLVDDDKEEDSIDEEPQWLPTTSANAADDDVSEKNAGMFQGDSESESSNGVLMVAMIGAGCVLAAAVFGVSIRRRHTNSEMDPDIKPGLGESYSSVFQIDTVPNFPNEATDEDYSGKATFTQYTDEALYSPTAIPEEAEYYEPSEGSSICSNSVMSFADNNQSQASDFSNSDMSFVDDGSVMSNSIFSTGSNSIVGSAFSNSIIDGESEAFSNSIIESEDRGGSEASGYSNSIFSEDRGSEASGYSDSVVSSAYTDSVFESEDRDSGYSNSQYSNSVMSDDDYQSEYSDDCGSSYSNDDCESENSDYSSVNLATDKRMSHVSEEAGGSERSSFDM